MGDGVCVPRLSVCLLCRVLLSTYPLEKYSFLSPALNVDGNVVFAVCLVGSVGFFSFLFTYPIQKYSFLSPALNMDGNVLFAVCLLGCVYLRLSLHSRQI